MVKYKITLSPEANDTLIELKNSKHKIGVNKAVHKALNLMKHSLRHPSLNTHEYDDLIGPKGQKVFESYAQNNTPGAYRIFWYYGENKGEIFILKICKHP